jgi:NADH-quinone oxidoreductase subunit N
MFEIPTLEALNLGVTVPVLSLALGTCVILLLDLFIPKTQKHITVGLALGTVVFSFIVNLFTFNSNTTAVFGAFIADSFAGYTNLIILVTTFVSILLSVDYLKRTGIERGEYYSLVLFSAVGTMMMGSANDLITLFVALELLSIPLYVLAAFRQPDVKSEESGIKYFILGAFASAFFVYGATLVYGATGTTSIPQIYASVQQILATSSSDQFFLLLGAALVLVGLGFKVAVVPFHMWTPDVYEGAPTPVTAFMSVGAKVGGFAALLRIFGVGLPAFALNGEQAATWQLAVAVVAAATLIIGNFVAIWQQNIKRMLAYSSIAHAGYIIMAVAAAGTASATDAGALAQNGASAAQGALIYMLAYAFTNLGAFGIVMALEKNDNSVVTLDHFKGLAKKNPVMAAMMTLFMLSLTGIPLTGGFMGKFFVFQATIQADLFLLAVVGILTSVASAFYYMRLVRNMYFEDGEVEIADWSPRLQWAVYISVAATLFIGIGFFFVVPLSQGVTLLATLPR